VKTLALTLLCTTVALATDPRGVKPRPGPADYPAHENSNQLTLAAAVLSADQVKSLFATDLREYTVIEVGLYPASGQTIDVTSVDFAMRIGAQGDIVRAANPHAIAASNQRKNRPSPSRGSDVTLYPTATIGYESGDVYDPVTGGRRRASSVYTGAGVGVGVGGAGAPPQAPRPGSTDRDREVMQQELLDKALPDGPVTAPVAGYLYFRLPPKAKNSALELQYYAGSHKVRVPLEPPKIK
jgi:hypothetical protein